MMGSVSTESLPKDSNVLITFAEFKKRKDTHTFEKHMSCQIGVGLDTWRKMSRTAQG